MWLLLNRVANPTLNQYIYIYIIINNYTERSVFLLLFTYYNRYAKTVTHDEGKAVTKKAFFIVQRNTFKSEK